MATGLLALSAFVLHFKVFAILKKYWLKTKIFFGAQKARIAIVVPGTEGNYFVRGCAPFERAEYCH